MFSENSIPLPRKRGRPKNLTDPEQLWDLAAGYFENVDENPWVASELIKSGDLAGVSVRVNKQRPYTWAGLNVYMIKMGYGLIDEYKRNRNGIHDNFSQVIKEIDEVMKNQKFDGAASGAFNPNIIARDLGLVERTMTEVRDTTEDFDYDGLSESALAEIAALKSKKAIEDDDLY